MTTKDYLNQISRLNRMKQIAKYSIIKLKTSIINLLYRCYISLY